jgi:hypothetical protein
VCAPTNRTFLQTFCPTPADFTCIARAGCFIVNGAAQCRADPDPVGEPCTRSTGAAGRCDGGTGVAACDPLPVAR